MNVRRTLAVLAVVALAAPLSACSALSRPDQISIQAEPAGPPKMPAPQPLQAAPGAAGAAAPQGIAQPPGG